jgi:hypothetical protein
LVWYVRRHCQKQHPASRHARDKPTVVLLTRPHASLCPIMPLEGLDIPPLSSCAFIYFWFTQHFSCFQTGAMLLLLTPISCCVVLTEPVPSRFIAAGSSPLILTLRYMLVNKDPATSILMLSLMLHYHCSNGHYCRHGHTLA